MKKEKFFGVLFGLMFVGGILLAVIWDRRALGTLLALASLGAGMAALYFGEQRVRAQFPSIFLVSSDGEKVGRDKGER